MSITKHYALAITAEDGRTILTIAVDGTLEFGPAAHPQEAVEKLRDLWQSIVKQEEP